MSPKSFSPIDFSTFEIGNAKLRKAVGVTYRIQGPLDAEWVIAENVIRSEFFRMGKQEYLFLALLDGERSLTNVYQSMCGATPNESLDESQVASMAMWAVESGLAEVVAMEGGRSVSNGNDHKPAKRNWREYNPLSFKVSLFNPDAWVVRLLPTVRWLFSPLGCILWFTFVTLGLLSVSMSFNAIFVQRVTAFTSHDLMWLIGTWLCLKFFHEAGHAFACRRFGAELGTSGLLFVLFLPIPYVDVTSIWRQEKRTLRMLVSASGILVEIWIASVAALVWNYQEPGVLRFHLENIILAASLNTMLVNANPLMRFDGYYLLSDWLGISNLFQKGRNYVRNLAEYLLLGIPFPAERSNLRERAIVRVYGLLSWGWGYVLSLSLLLVAFSLADGIGLVLAAIGLMHWFVVPMVFGLGKILWRLRANRSSWARAAASCFAMAGLILLIFSVVPSPSVIQAPVVVDLANREAIYTEFDGFVKEVFVRTGDQISPGQPIVQLDTRELEMERERLRSTLEQIQIRAQRYLTAGRVAEHQREQESFRSKMAEYQAIEGRVKKMLICSPGIGVMLSHDVMNLQGKFIRSGSKIAEVGDLNTMRAIALIDLPNGRWLGEKGALVGRVSIDGGSHSDHSAKIAKIHPRATDYLPHQAFAANFGGLLDTLDRSLVESKVLSESAPLGDDSWNQAADGAILAAPAQATKGLKLTKPRLQVDLELDLVAKGERNLYPGQTGTLFIREREQSLGAYWVDLVYRSIQDQLRANHGL